MSPHHPHRPHLDATSMRRSRAASMLLSLMEGSTAKSNSSLTVRIATPESAMEGKGGGR